MTRKQASDFHPEVLQLFDQFVHGRLSRRGFLDAAGKYALAGGLTAAGLLAALEPDFALGQQVKPDDARIKTRFVEFPSPEGNGKVRAYLAEPAKASGKLPTVLVVHENRGLNPHIEDVARRLALDGFVALAPDALFPLGGYPGNEDKARELFGKLDQARTRSDFAAAAEYLKTLPEGNGKEGVVGFCWGGAMANYLPTRVQSIDAAVSFYGPGPSADEVAKIRAPMLINHASNDQWVNSNWPAFEEALKKNKVKYEEFTYPNTEHGFNNDTTPRYKPEAAKQAWDRTIAFFKKNLAA
jgi:carboxymethylenebutenolidase